MICVSRPKRESIQALLQAERGLRFPYGEVGATRASDAPPGYTVDHNRVLLGRGAEVFARAKQAIRAWKMFEMDWLELCWNDAAIEVGSTVGVLVGHYGFWSLNPCRIAYVLEERGRVEKFGFAYGTLPGHAEIGEERFSVEFDPRDSSVWYDLYAFSRPGVMARMGYPLARALQKRFARDSMAAMQLAVGVR
jgi:uncharacterized protein (UPF0548 family)